MRLLLDTNALLWWFENSSRLRSEPRAAIEDPANHVFVSAASAWEIAVKVSIRKLPAPPNVAAWLPGQLESNGFVSLSVTLAHAVAVEMLPYHHRDPFDRLLIAQALAEQFTIVTGDAAFARYNVPLIRC